MLVVDRRQRDLVPALADRKSAVVEIAAAPASPKPINGTVWAAPVLSAISDDEVLDADAVAASDLATDLVEGQRARPSGVIRLDLLKVVGSSPARLASPDGDSPARARRN